MLNDPLDPSVSETVWMIASQLCKTASIIVICEYFMHQQPSPILVVYPTEASAESFSKEKLSPSISETPCLKGLIKDHRSRDANNTTLNKRFPGGNITMSGSNSPSGLRQRSKRVVIMDELDAFEDNKEGDPVELADKRAETFGNAVKLKSSTPTVRGASRIEKIFNESDQQRFFCPCPKCGAYQVLRWSQVKWPEDKPEEAYYECEKQDCASKLTDQERMAMIRKGEWRATAPFRGVRGRHLSGLYRLMGKKKAFRNYLHEFVSGFLKAKKKGKSSLMAWTNTFLAETFAEETVKANPHALHERREVYTVPNKVLVVTAGCDVQSDRVEIEIVGWGKDEESWGLQYIVVPGRYDDPETWAGVDAILGQKIEREDGVTLTIAAAIVDSGAFQDHVLKYTRSKTARRIFGGKGVNASGHPVLSSVSHGNKLRAPQYRIGTDTAKGIIADRLQLLESGPGYMHFPQEPSAGYGLKYFDMLTAEEFRVIWRKGVMYREWVKLDNRRNEALDCRVYALAALYHLNPNWLRLEKNLAEIKPSQKVVPKTETQSQASEPPTQDRGTEAAGTAVAAPDVAVARKKVAVRRPVLGGMMRFRPY